jgi:hypothetical protein
MGKEGLKHRGLLPSTIAMVDIANNVPDFEYMDASIVDVCDELSLVVDELLLMEQ